MRVQQKQILKTVGVFPAMMVQAREWWGCDLWNISHDEDGDRKYYNCKSVQQKLNWIIGVYTGLVNQERAR